MNGVYVIAVKCLSDDRWKYAYTDHVCYHLWTDYVDDADSFWDIESAEEWFNQNKTDLFNMTTVQSEKYDLNSVCIKKVTFIGPICETKKNLNF